MMSNRSSLFAGRQAPSMKNAWWSIVVMRLTLHSLNGPMGPDESSNQTEFASI